MYMCMYHVTVSILENITHYTAVIAMVRVAAFFDCRCSTNNSTSGMVVVVVVVVVVEVVVVVGSLFMNFNKRKVYSMK